MSTYLTNCGVELLAQVTADRAHTIGISIAGLLATKTVLMKSMKYDLFTEPIRSRWLPFFTSLPRIEADGGLIGAVGGL